MRSESLPRPRQVRHRDGVDRFAGPWLGMQPERGRLDRSVAFRIEFGWGRKLMDACEHRRPRGLLSGRCSESRWPMR